MTGPRSWPSLADKLSARQNGFGLLRLLLSLAVVVAHGRQIGFGLSSPLYEPSHHQVGLGDLAVCGFFALSGLLITRSAMRINLRRFLWHRMVRILPGFWACLLVTVFIAGPILARHDGIPLHRYLHDPSGPWAYLQANWSLSWGQAGISGILAHVPIPGEINGSIWSLRLEMLCYLAVAALAATEVLRRNRAVVLLLVLGGWLYLWTIVAGAPQLRSYIYAPTPDNWTLPFLGAISLSQLLPLMVIFGLGALAQLYREQLPVHGSLALVSAALCVGTFHYGGFTVVGIPAFVYLVIWCGVSTPRPLTRIGSKVDLSYGLYIYSFIVEQGLVAFHGNRWGLLPYLAIAFTVSLGAAACSWHLVERPALRWKDRTLGELLPPFLRGRPAAHGPAMDGAAPAVVPAPAARESVESGAANRHRRTSL
ncbi:MULTISPECIES: acyltransferase family protein [unclassified Kitasatospora]|uniref:acyltransferase family protein n=1 Tax=unclassified Kitasatospora TaxID=2633591 RepID=UPI002475BE0F|nr:acyltransferase [Kitasatospora sp. MAP12-44]